MNSELEHLHKVELLIMDEIHRICTKYKIQYFLDSGSALGAIRHSGFIPWDDDVDIGMLREDYNRFLNVASSELDERFFLQTKETDPTFPKYCAKVRLNETFLREKTTEGTEYHHGIFIDIFPFDPISSSPLIAKVQIRHSRLCWRLLRFRQRKMAYNGVKGVVQAVVQKIPCYAFEKMYVASCTHSGGLNPRTLTCYSYKMFQTHDLWFEADWFKPVKCVTFEDREYLIMNQPEQYLHRMFGDYMKLPPESQRKCHVIDTIDFGAY